MLRQQENVNPQLLEESRGGDLGVFFPFPNVPSNLGSAEANAETSTASPRDYTPAFPVVTPRASFHLPREIKGLRDIFLSKINILLVIIPFGVLSYILKQNTLLVFAFNFIALVPLSSLLGAATEELALHTGEITGGLLNATFGNAVEMIMAFQALKKGLILVVQGTLLGSILSNLLLVLGTSFLMGGMRYHVQKFNEKGATCSTSLLLLASLSISIPTLGGSAIHISKVDILFISRISAMAVILMYVLFLLFQLRTHFHLFQDVRADDETEKELPGIGWVTGVVLLFIVTVFIAFISEFLVASIEPLIKGYGIKEDFIGVILLPIVGNAAEHVTAVTVAAKNKVDLTIGVAIGSSVQIALLVVPFTVISGWIIDQPMTLEFPILSALVLILSVIVVTGIVQDGESNWLEGAMLIVAYSLVAVVFWYYN
ncbi:putative manganese resistance 1 protein [Cardiosporidium cionae]|uniref:Manganese resistance 1 protein n=1 Tax=Cardiosporidium cionae TaxID=476202 RepID=A0ABQ7JDU9_9APIC|nr:putative manganese resistance 1 protein [Cardiosporidium cionae]|eukprot:KAF8822139.1 putative manganese resistance 1 protein [Cardiosporidium cionae]